MKFGISTPIRSDTPGNLNEAASAFLNPNLIHTGNTRHCYCSSSSAWHMSEAELEAEGVLKLNMVACPRLEVFSVK